MTSARPKRDSRILIVRCGATARVAAGLAGGASGAQPRWRRPTHHLHVGDGHVEVLRQVGVPHDAHISDEEGTQVALVRGQVPNAHDLSGAVEGGVTSDGARRTEAARRRAAGRGPDLVVHLLAGQHYELLVLDHRAAQLEVPVQARRLVGAAGERTAVSLARAPTAARATHRPTLCTVVNSRGLARTSDVKMNSKRLLLKRVMRCSPCTLPRNLEFVVLMLMFWMHANPMPAVGGERAIPHRGLAQGGERARRSH